MIPIALKIRDIGPFETLDFRFSSETGKTFFIKGVNHDKGFSANGAGKSMIFDIITWILYDMTYRDVSKDLMLRNDRKNGKCKYGYAVFLFKERNVVYYVRRERGKGNSVEVGIYESNKFNKIKCGHRKRDVELKILEIIGADFDMFCSVAYLGGGYSKFLESKSGERLSLFISLLGSGLTETRLVETNVKTEWKKLNEDLDRLRTENEVYQNELSELDSFSLLRKKKDLKRVLKEDENNLTLISEDIFALENKTKLEENELRLQLESKSFKSVTEQFDKNEEKIKSEIKQSEKEVLRLKKETEETSSVFEAGEETREKIKTIKDKKSGVMTKISKLEVKIGIIQTEILRINDLLFRTKGDCPYCFSPLSSDLSKTGLEKAKKRESDKRRKYVLERNDLQTESKKFDSELRNLNSELEVNDNAVREIASKEEKLKSEKRILKGLNDRLISDSKVSKNNRELFVDSVQQLKNCKAELKKVKLTLGKIEMSYEDLCSDRYELESVIHDYKLKIDRVRVSIAKAKRLNSEVKKRRESIEKINSETNIVQWCLFNLPKIKGKIIDSIKTPFTNKTNEYLNQIYPDIMIEYVIVVGDKKREKFDINIINKCNGVVEKYEQKSGGEKKRISLAVILALNWLASALNNLDFGFLFLDEVFGNVDGVGGSSVITLLQEEKWKKNLYVITLQENVERYGDVITVIKENGISRIETKKKVV